MHSSPSTASNLEERVERQQRTIERLERKVEALASAADVQFAGPCDRCEEGLLVWGDGALSCTSCTFSQVV